MKGTLLIGCCAWLVFGASAYAQPRFEAPDQFYTDGVQIDGWKDDDEAGQMVSLWFGKNPRNSLSYRQLLAIVKDDQPNLILYYDLVARRYVGRYDMEQDGYSLLAPQDRKERLQDIRESMFPPPGDKPAIGELFDPLPNADPNDEQLMMPPATMAFPRLRESTWEGFYTDLEGNRRKMKLELDGNEGTYQATEVDLQGDLNNVQYTRRPDMVVIRGNWSAGQTGGPFEFRIMMMNLNEFQGTYRERNKNRVHIWDGKRTSR